MSATQQMSPAQQNAYARAAVLGTAVDMWQTIYSQTVVPANGNVVNIVPRNVGLIKGFLVKVVAQLNVTNAAVLALTPLGTSNILSQVVFTDLSNYTRINTAGWHLVMVTSAKLRQPYGAALLTTTDDDGVGWGNNYNVMGNAPATIAATGNNNFLTMWYYVPLAYHDRDLRGAVYANVVNATMNLQLTINPTPMVLGVNDATLAVYSGATAAAATFSNVAITVYQNFLDQLPVGKNGVVLPYQDLSTIYELKNTALTGIVTAQDFPIVYTNFRDFLSTCVILDNGGQLYGGTDINYWGLQSANFTNILKVEPNWVALQARNRIRTDFPRGVTYFDHRNKPISTVQYGNMNLNLNAGTAAQALATNSVVLVGFEDMGTMNSIIPAGSLPGG